MPFIFGVGLGIAVLFFLIIPLLGAFTVRRRWREFRFLFYHIKQQPVFKGHLDKDSDWQGQIFASIEGVQGKNRLWLQSEERSLQLNAENADIYALHTLQHNTRPANLAVAPVKVAWRELGPIPLGSQVLVWGRIIKQSGRLEIIPVQKGSNLVIVFFEGPPTSAISRLIANGRQHNEFWSLITPFSLLIGFVLISIVSFAALRTLPQRIWPVLLAVLAVSPFAILLPPGLVGYYWYRRLWRMGKRIRAKRDVLWCTITKSTLRPDLAKMAKKAVRFEKAAILVFAFALVINCTLLFLLAVHLLNSRALSQ